MRDEKAIAIRTISPGHSSVGEEVKDVCDDCQRLELSVLFKPFPEDLPQETINQEVGNRVVIIPCEGVIRALNNTRCMLCRLVVKCGILSGLFEKKNEKVSDFDCTYANIKNLDFGVWRIQGKAIICALRPKFSWKTPRNDSPGAQDEPTPTLEHSGQIHVEFYEMMTGSKWAFDPMRPLVGSQTTPWRSLVASWTVDIVCTYYSDVASRRAPIEGTGQIPFLRQWLHKCNHEHRHDSRVAGISVPLSDLSLSRYLRAINTTTGKTAMLSPDASFAALSYVWGPDTRRRSLSWKRWSGLEEYPATIRDAAFLAKTLGYEWLWVDRFCVDQDDESEKARLFPYMKDIFAAAELTIVAACGDGAHSGLRGVGQTERDAERCFDVKSGEYISRLVPAAVSFNVQLERSVWRTRGWTFEEHVFSRRLLYVFPSEMFFSCSKGTFREATGDAFSTQSAGSTWGDGGRTPPTIAGELHSKFHGTRSSAENMMTAREYVRAVEEYSARGLSFEEDRIVAFAGLVAAASGAQDAIDLASLLTHGQPLMFFETLLTWHHEEGHVRRYPTIDQAFAPSWSWASAGTKLSFLDSGEEHTRCRWFRYSSIGGFDILGLPVERHIPLLGSIAMPFPDHIIMKAPWEAERGDLPPGYDESQADEALPSTPRSLPRLHLLTVIFKAVLHSAPCGQHRIQSIETPGSGGGGVTGRWSINADVPEPAEDRPVARLLTRRRATGRKEHQSVREGHPYTFALVGSYNHLYIMLLQPEDDDRTFSRMGLFKQALLAGSARLFQRIIQAGEPRWEYIRII